MLRPGAGELAHLALTVDIKTKLMRSKSLLDTIADGNANFKVNPNEATNLNVVIIVHESVAKQAPTMYDRIRKMVNSLNASFRFPEKPYEIAAAGDLESVVVSHIIH